MLPKANLFVSNGAGVASGVGAADPNGQATPEGGPKFDLADLARLSQVGFVALVELFGELRSVYVALTNIFSLYRNFYRTPALSHSLAPPRTCSRRRTCSSRLPEPRGSEGA